MSHALSPETIDRSDSDGRSNAAISAGQIDALYRMGGHFFSLPFSAVCLAALIHTGTVPLWFATGPFLLQLACAVGTGRLMAAYGLRHNAADTQLWARRYVLASALSGGALGAGAIAWFVTDGFQSEALLAATFMGATLAEFITRSVYRPAYLAFAVFSLAPLVFMLVFKGDIYGALLSVPIVLFAAALYRHSDEVASVVDHIVSLRSI
jgi:hypothetical protein